MTPVQFKIFFKHFFSNFAESLLIKLPKPPDKPPKPPDKPPKLPVVLISTTLNQ